MRPLIALGLLLGLGLATLAPTSVRAQDPTPIGHVKSLDGAAFIITGDDRRAAKLGDAIVQNDVLETGEPGAIGVTFIDDTMVSLGPDTRLTIDEYVFSPADGQYSFVSKVGKGTMLFVSGVMGKLAPEAVSVETPAGTIGIRGTRFLVQVKDSGA